MRQHFLEVGAKSARRGRHCWNAVVINNARGSTVDTGGFRVSESRQVPYELEPANDVAGLAGRHLGRSRSRMAMRTPAGILLVVTLPLPAPRWHLSREGVKLGCPKAACR